VVDDEVNAVKRRARWPRPERHHGIEDTAKAITLGATPDVIQRRLTYAMRVAAGPRHVTGSRRRSRTYSAEPGLLRGPTASRFKANDTLLDSNVATVSITVNASTTHRWRRGRASRRMRHLEGDHRCAATDVIDGLT